MIQTFLLVFSFHLQVSLIARFVMPLSAHSHHITDRNDGYEYPIYCLIDANDSSGALLSLYLEI
ncbi:hypothetical protein [Bacillus sp. NPDC094106]|uniref:hypothetical protein n=1 Tax=Bacillus sp. NPDC094106 TaxID=3363949 RepID=UPI00380D8C7A